MTSTDFTPTKVYQQNDWSVVMVDERVYRITDPVGNQCVTRSVRVISCDEFVVAHPFVPDIKINTRRLRSLPVSCRGDLTNEDHPMRADYIDRETYLGPTQIHVHNDPVSRGNIVYHGSNGPSD
jgi:hypothetical protein